MRNSYAPARAVKINYIALLMLIITGVTLGGLLSTWITIRILDYQAQKSIEEARKQLVREEQRLANQLLAQQKTITKQDRGARRNSKEGVMYLNKCAEWLRADAELATPTTKIEAGKHCSNYKNFVNHGFLPRH